MSARQTRRAPCPRCDKGPWDTALAITTDERGTVAYCHRCRYVETDSRSAPSVNSDDADVGVHKSLTRRTNDRTLTSDLDRLARIWSRTVPLRGTLGETYLRHRHCVIPPTDSDLRYLPDFFQGGRNYPPSLCALVTDIVTAEPISLHFTRLASDGKGKAGTERDKLLLAGHRKAGGCIRLWPDEAVTTHLGIAEGIETALCAAHGFTPVWATIDAGNMAAFPVLEGIETLVAFADHDEAGLKAARACGQRWADAGREVRVVVPEQDGTDVADAVAA